VIEKIEIKNKKAHFQYFLLDTFVAGLQLLGTEIKAIREGKANLADAYCVFLNDELFIKNLHIAEYSHGSYANHEPRRMRKLLLNKRELKKIQGKLKEKGLTIIPVILFVNQKGLAKIEISVAKGKKLFDKRDTIKTKDVKRQLDRIKKNY
jgi:SsrA-binding protein